MEEQTTENDNNHRQQTYNKEQQTHNKELEETRKKDPVEIYEETKNTEENQTNIEEETEESIEEEVEEVTDRLDVLINLLIKKNIITEDEMEAEFESWIAEKEKEEDQQDNN